MDLPTPAGRARTEPGREWEPAPISEITQPPSDPGSGEDQLGLRPLKALTLAERVIDPEQIPWVPYTETIWVKPLRLNRKTGQWANITKVVGGGQINRHYHVNGVVGYVLDGSWYYAEKDWVARPGMMVWEPPGDVHTLISGEGGTITMFQLEGALLYVDEEDNVVGFDDVLNHTRTYHDFCVAEGIEPLDLDY
ncbi:MAG TPA: 2,4'-dihydroxyacetophenone dioxygenase family protein [Solirubrobacterales bacterium]